MLLFSQITEPGRGETLLGLARAHWPILATAGLGFLGIYGLLPQARRTRPVWAGLVAALAVLAAGMWLVRFEGAWPERVLFAGFSLLAIGGAVMMLAQSNPVHAALSFAVVVLSTAGLFLLLAAPFLMAATLIIYAGAIVVTFLFVIMLAQQAGLASADARSREPFLASLAGFVLLGSLWCVLDRTYNSERLVRQLDQVAQAASLDDVTRLWGNPDDQADKKVLPAVEDLRRRFPEELVFNLEHAWSRRNLDDLKKHAAILYSYAHAERERRGMLYVPGKTDAKPPLEAQNVAAVGRTLFSKYLVPVQLAGVLLLVATIGAIVIAGRRTEGLR